MLDVYAVLGGPGELSLAFRVIEQGRSTSGRGAALIVDRRFEPFARQFNGVDDVIALDVPADATTRLQLLEKLAANIGTSGARFHALTTAQLVERTHGRGLPVPDPQADTHATQLLGDLAKSRFALVILEESGLTRPEHLSELAWAAQRRGFSIVVASTGPVPESLFWRRLQGLDARVFARLAQRCAIAISASTDSAYLLCTYAPMTCVYVMHGCDPAQFSQTGLTAAVPSLSDAATRLPLQTLLQALGEEMRDRVCPDCGTSTGELAITRNARWIACDACPAIYPAPVAA